LGRSLCTWMESVKVMHASGTIDTCQCAPITVGLDVARLEQLYWDAARRTTLGSVRFSGDALRLLGVWPVLLRFGPVVDGLSLIHI